MVDVVALQQFFGFPVIQLQAHATHFGALQETKIFVSLPVAGAFDEALNPEVGARRGQHRCGCGLFSHEKLRTREAEMSPYCNQLHD
jgi:hypothetical protein